MTVLQVADLRFGYAGETLFENVTFTFALGERAGLVAPNGAGKSTLLRLIAKEAEPDAGTAVIKKETTLGYYRQSHELKPEGDVLGAFLSGFRDVMTLREELTKAQHDAASGDARALDHLARPVASLPGGERGRLQLGVVLAQQPDLLLLDEPTNHLDLDTIAWLESWLVGYRGAVLLVSHDRQFLDYVCPQTLELGARLLRSYPL